MVIAFLQFCQGLAFFISGIEDDAKQAECVDYIIKHSKDKFEEKRYDIYLNTYFFG